MLHLHKSWISGTRWTEGLSSERACNQRPAKWLMWFVPIPAQQTLRISSDRSGFIQQNPPSTPFTAALRQKWRLCPLALAPDTNLAVWPGIMNLNSWTVGPRAESVNVSNQKLAALAVPPASIQPTGAISMELRLSAVRQDLTMGPAFECRQFLTPHW